jgi:hypothetical protein
MATTAMIEFKRILNFNLLSPIAGGYSPTLSTVKMNAVSVRVFHA